MTSSFDAHRRRFLQLGMTAMAATAAFPAMAAMPRLEGVRRLAFHNLHTDEKLHVAYWKNGSYDRAAWAKIDHILRDHYSGETHPINPRLMDLLFDLQGRLNNESRIEVISCYRSPKTNLVLASLSDGVAKRSYHTKGMAIDIRLPGSSLAKIHETALAMKRGGVGYYPASDFVHVDVGPLRKW